MELIKSYVSNTCYYVEVENSALLRDVTQSWKMIIGGHGKTWKKSWKIFWEKRGNPGASGCGGLVASNVGN